MITLDLAKKMELIFLKKNFREKLKKRGLKRSKTFTWTKCAIDTKKLYSRLLQKKLS